MALRVETASGRLAGVQEDGLVAFRGVPFAKPPLGPLRLRAPEPPDPWSGVRDASEFGPSAPQNKVQFDLLGGLGVGAQSEDCLYLNVYTPAADAGRRPVMVWIHGGAFTIGSGSQGFYEVRNLVRRGGVVLVSINYRLGALGFLHLGELLGPEERVSANVGILDQIRALEWVRENAAAFGGDPQEVTIFGESAGGMSVGTLLGTPTARGLFRRAIAQSGAAHRVNSGAEAARVAEGLLEHLGLDRARAARLLELPVEAILEAQGRVALEIERESARRAFCPSVDGRVLPRHPIDEIAAGLSRGVPVLIGTTRDEWKLFVQVDAQAARLDEARLVERMEARVPGRGRALVEAYRRARPGASPRELFAALETDRVFRIPAIRLAELQAPHEPRIFAYRMDWESPLADGALGACHGIDVPFVFGLVGTRGGRSFAGGGPEAERLSARMMDAWLGFARSGEPGHADLPAWPCYERARRSTLIFDRECRVESAPADAERAAWEGIL